MSTNSTGLPGYRGYEYQIVVSVWVALDLMLVRRLCNMIEIEPATQEDIAAKPGAPAETAESKLNISFREERFSIQIKHNAGTWSAAAFMDLLTTRPKKGLPGPAPRERALSRLTADPSLRYLLITDAPVEATLADFVVEEISEASRATGGKYASTSATRVAPSLVRSRSCPP